MVETVREACEPMSNCTLFADSFKDGECVPILMQRAAVFDELHEVLDSVCEL